MILLELQKFLMRFYTPQYGIAELEEKYAIKAKQHGTYPNLYLFKYNQIESPFGEKIVQEARGIILDANRDWAVVAMPYTKFFNHGETHAAEINWNTAKVQEKVDGSLITLYHYRDKWWVATSGTPDANTPIGDFNLTFEDLFWWAFDKEGLCMKDLDTDFTYIFELCAPQNRVVVVHNEAKLFLHGVRSMKDLKERNPEIHAVILGCKLPKLFGLRSIEECVEAAKHLQPLAIEGFVVCDANFNRLKIKSPAYVVLHHSKDGLLSMKRMAGLIRDGETEEFQKALDAFPELAPNFYKLKDRYDEIISSCETYYADLKHIADQKQFALALKGCLAETSCGVVFRMRKTGCSAKAAVASLTEAAYLRLMAVT